MNFRIAALVFSVMFFAGGCGGDEAANETAAHDQSVPIKRKTGSFLEDYKASRQGVKQTKPLKVSGAWEGILFCPSGAFPISIELSQTTTVVEGVATIDSAIGDERRTTPFYVDHRERKGSGEYSPQIQTFTFRSDPENGADPRRERGVFIEFMLSPSNGDMANINVSETSAARSQRQCGGVAARNEAAKKISSFKESARLIRADRRAVIQGRKCPPKYRNWLDQVSAGASAFDDKIFMPTFGASFRDMDAEELLKASALISGSCAETNDRAKNIEVLRIGATLRNYKEYDAANQSYLKNAVLDDWISWVDEEIKRGVYFDYSTAVALRAAPIRTGLRGDPKVAEFDGRLAALVEEAKTSKSTHNFVQRIEDQKENFKTLVNIPLEAQSRGDIDMNVVSTGLDYYLADAAQIFADNVDTVREAVYIHSWSTHFEASDACPAASRSTCQKVAAAFTKKSKELAATYAKAEAQAFKEISGHARGTDRLVQLVTFENRLVRDYGGLLTLAPFENGKRQRENARRALQKKNARAIREEIETANMAPAIRTIEAKYFVGDDLEAPSVRQVAAAIEKAIAGTKPFAGIAGGDYFNALYNQDFATLRALDRDYVAGIRPLMSFGAQQVIELGPLINALSGQKAGQVETDIAHWVQNLSALYAVFGTYLVEYQNVYEKCLKPGAATIEISKRTDYVTTDGFGNEISRREGWTDRDYYRVNPEFSGHFNTLFGAATGTAQARLFDLFLNDAKISSLRLDTETLMSKYECDSPEIKQLEKGFLAYDRELKRR